MKTVTKIIISLFIIFSFFSLTNSQGIIEIPDAENIKKVSIEPPVSGGMVGNINNIGFSLLVSIKYILSGVLLIFMVYIGIQMIISMGSDEEELSKAKRQILYSSIGLVFINIPGSIYEVLKKEEPGIIDNRIIYGSWIKDNNDSNIFFDFFYFGETVNENIVGFLEVLILAVAIFIIVLSGITMIISRGKEENIKESKNKIIYSIIALIFVGFIEVWKKFAFKGKISDGTAIFEALSNLALFFAGPIAIFFLTLAGYYYITSNDDENRVKKAKSIVINTVIATVILLASYTFLLDLADLFG